MKKINKYIRFVLVLWVMVLCIFNSQKAEAQYSSYEFKAGIIFTLTKFTIWNEEVFDKKNNTIVLTIFGTDPFGNIMEDVVRGRTSNGRQVEIRRTKLLKDLKGSHIVFISRSERHDVCKILDYIRTFKHSSVLTIGDEIDDFCARGGMVRLNQNFTFKLNWGEMSKSSLQPDQRLLNLAEQVVPTDEERCQ